MYKAITVAVLVALAPIAVAYSSTFSDVPGDHWAYEAIDYLQQGGLVEGYPDGTFKGARPFTRYEMAMVVARIFTKIQDWQAMEGGPGANPLADGSVEMSEVYARLDRLSDEFRDELSDLGARITSVEDEQYRLRGDVDDIKALIQDSGLSGEARWRMGGFTGTGSQDRANEIGLESYITMTYLFTPDDNLDFKLSMTSSEIEGGAGTGFIPGANNESGSVSPGGTPPFRNFAKGSSFVVDEAHFKYYWNSAPEVLGDYPIVTGGRQYFSEGEFGLAGDNGYRSNFGLRFDTSYGANFSAHAAFYRMESITDFAPWDNADPLAFQSSTLSAEGDDFLMLGLEYHSGEATTPGHDYKIALRIDGAMNGYGAEEYIGLSGNAEIPFFGNTFLNGIRGEWVAVTKNVSNFDPEADLGLTHHSFIVELDVYNDPFSEWDFTINEAGDAFNLSRQGPNYFPADFTGIGFRAEHRFGTSVDSTFTYYGGKRIDATQVGGNTADARPAVAALNLRFPFTDNSSLGFDFITAGEREGLEDPISLVRGEFKIHF